MSSLLVHAQDDLGATLYNAKCAVCHGADGTASTPAGKKIKAKNLRSSSVVKMPNEKIVRVIKNGKEKMPAFGKKLTDDEITAIVRYIRTLQ